MATTALARLSPLSVWWTRLFIRAELVEPGHPGQNGGHERTHKTLRPRPLGPASGSPRAAAARRHVSRRGQLRAAARSAGAGDAGELLRDLTARVAGAPRTARVSGPLRGAPRQSQRWHPVAQPLGVNVSHVLGDEYIAFEEIEDVLWQVSFGPVALGRFHEVLLRVRRPARRPGPHAPAHRPHPSEVLPMSSDYVVTDVLDRSVAMLTIYGKPPRICSHVGAPGGRRAS